MLSGLTLFLGGTLNRPLQNNKARFVGEEAHPFDREVCKGDNPLDRAGVFMLSVGSKRVKIWKRAFEQE